MKIIHNLDLTEYNSYKLHSIAETAFFPETTEEVVDTVKNANPIVIGGGCNVIFSKENYSRPIMFIRDNYSGIRQDGERLIVNAGTDLKVLSEYAYAQSLTGLEWYYDIPGCVGGATIMNAGCQGVSFCDFIESIKYLDCSSNSILTIDKKAAGFEYRGNIFASIPVVILEVSLILCKGEKDVIWEKMQSNKNNRWSKQPREYPSAGSVFKRPVGHYVGPMITEVGLKGYRIGGAMISDKHAGFIINCDGATSNDILDLITLAKSRVKEVFDVDLQLEQRII